MRLRFRNHSAVISWLFLIAYSAHAGASPPNGSSLNDSPPNMVWINGGTFVMGSNDPLARADEQPTHRVWVDGFWIDQTEVTNKQFRAFVDATHFVTTAEKTVDWDELKKQVAPGTPKPPDEMLKPGSLVFTPPDHPVDLNDFSQWWQWRAGASWRHPTGPDSAIDGKDDLPVVQVSFDDAMAYCKWAGKQLPTEAQWEFAARGGLEGKVNVWGDAPVDPKRANTWQGHFPDHNTAEDGYAGPAPVGKFPANGYGLYDMSGNVWEWCADQYDFNAYAAIVTKTGTDAIAVNPINTDKTFDPRNPGVPVLYVQRGGSFLCNDSYCASYRPSARMGATSDSAAMHSGFRCVIVPTGLLPATRAR